MSVTIEQLRADPARYNQRLIHTSGIRVSSWEGGLAISDGLEVHGGVAGGNFKSLKEPSIFLLNVMVEHERGCISETGLIRAVFCTVDVTGVFEYGGQYGNLGMYKFQLRGSAPTPTGQSETQAIPLESVEPVGTVTIEARPAQPPAGVPVQAASPSPGVPVQAQAVSPSLYAVPSQQPARPLQAPHVGSSQETKASESSMSSTPTRATER